MAARSLNAFTSRYTSYLQSQHRMLARNKRKSFIWGSFSTSGLVTRDLGVLECHLHFAAQDPGGVVLVTSHFHETLEGHGLIHEGFMHCLGIWITRRDQDSFELLSNNGPPSMGFQA
ncbi:dihydroxyacetone kinase [Aspergillus luchuensis]|uniref:Dihydroxyacetone kinase n=1 Tax=Aspergillus kawachii TaxID=1069201 RepID=A0A146FGJ7_ASPKA|nr:dihydroxyacetone kinase [Aspergillus luchuensis]